MNELAPKLQNKNLKPSLCKGRWHASAWRKGCFSKQILKRERLSLQYNYFLYYIQVFSYLKIKTNRRGCLQAHPLLTPARPLCKTEEKIKNPLEILPSLWRMQFLHLVLAKCLTHNGTYILREAFPVISSEILIFLSPSFCKAELEQGSFAPKSQNKNLKPSLCKGRWHALAWRKGCFSKKD